MKHIDPVRLQASLLSSYEECYTFVPVSPLSEEREVPLEALFTEAIIVEEIKVVRETKEVLVRSYRDVFYNKVNESNAKSIFVLGQAGVGKTVYSQQMMNTWIKAQRKLQAGKLQLDEDEEMMSEFDFLFYIPLKYTSKAESLLDVVYECVGDDKVNRDTTKHIFNVCPDRILVICDGLDEIDWYPSRHNFHMFTIVSTTRPWKYDIVRGRSPRSDKVLQLKGLSKRGVLQLAQRLESTYYKDQPESSLQNFLDDIHKLGFVDTLNESPQILVYLQHVWNQTKSLSTSLTETLIGIIGYILQHGENKLISGGDSLLEQDFSLSQKEMKGISLSPVCYKYGKLLMTAAEIAFKGLTNAKKDHTLVFLDANLQYSLGKKFVNLKACLKLGLFSKSEKILILHKEAHISFPHKLFQELFMALHIVNNQTALTEFCNYCNTLDKVLEMSDVFTFTAALCRKTASQLSKHVVDICDRDNDILDVRSNIFATSQKMTKDLTLMMIKCMEECMKQKGQGKCQIYLNDMHIESDEGDTNWSIVSELIRTNSSRLKSFYCEASYKDRSDHVNTILQDLTKVKTLTCLHVECVDKMDNQTTVCLNKIMGNNRQLCVLDVSCKCQSPLQHPGLQLPPLPHLQHMYICPDLTIPKSLRKLSALTALGQLHTLQLDRMILQDYFLDLSRLTHLTHLRMDRVEASSAVWWRMLQSMNNIPALQDFVFLNPGTTDNGNIAIPPPANIHLSFVSRLHKLTLYHLGRSYLFHPILKDFDGNDQLRSLEVNWWNIPDTPVTRLLGAMRHHKHLEDLYLTGINTQNKSLDLNFNLNLKQLAIFKVTMSTAEWSMLFTDIKGLQHLTKLSINLRYVPRPDPACWLLLFDSIQSLPHLIQLKLYCVNIPEEAVKLPSQVRVTVKTLNHEGNISMFVFEADTEKATEQA